MAASVLCHYQIMQKKWKLDINIFAITGIGINKTSPQKRKFTLINCNILVKQYCCDRKNVFHYSRNGSKNLPVDTGRKLKVHKTFRRRTGRLLNVLCTFSLRSVSTGLKALNFSLCD